MRYSVRGILPGVRKNENVNRWILRTGLTRRQPTFSAFPFMFLFPLPVFFWYYICKEATLTVFKPHVSDFYRTCIYLTDQKNGFRHTSAHPV